MLAKPKPRRRLVLRSVGPTGAGTKADAARRSPLGEDGSRQNRAAGVLIFSAAILEKKTGEREALAAAPVLHIRFPRPWSLVAENPKIQNGRKGWTENPRRGSKQSTAFCKGNDSIMTFDVVAGTILAHKTVKGDHHSRL